MTGSWRRALAGAAGLAGALAALVGSPYRARPEARAHGAASLDSQGRGEARSIDVAALAREVSDEADHVSAVELAAWLRERRPGLRVLDVRSASEFAAYHLPTAEHLPLDQLSATRFAPDETIVLYSEAGVHGAQAWVFLRALGHRRVYFLRRGLHEWLDDVMSPTLAADASPEARARFERVEELSRWFGGLPRRLTAESYEAASAAPRGRGC